MDKNNKARPKETPQGASQYDKVFIGLDVHKKDIHAAIRINGQLVRMAVMPAIPKAVLAFIKPYQRGVKKLVYEAGPTGFGLVRYLRAAGIAAAVIAPSKVLRPAAASAKSDSLDCRKLAELAEKSLLSEVAIPTPEEEEARQVQRRRDSILKDRRRAKQRIRSFLLNHGLEDIPCWNQKVIQELMKRSLPDGLRFTLDLLVEDLVYLQSQLERAEHKLKQIAKSDRFAKAVRRLQTHPGVGDTTSIQVATELYQPGRFKNAKQVAAYVGLAPKVMQSGLTRTEGPLLKGGRGALRATLVEASWMWIRVEKRAHKYYARLVRNTGSGKKAIIALARKMLIHLWIMLVRQEDYRPMAA